MTHHSNSKGGSQIRWIRTFGSGWPMHEGVPGARQFGDFIGTIRFDRIEGFYPNQQDPNYLNIEFRGDTNESNERTMVLKSEVHQIEPALAATYPLPQGGQK